VLSAASIFGRAESWCKEDGRPLEFASQEAAEAYAKECNSHTTANVHYFVKEKEPEPGAVRKDGTQPNRATRAHEEQTPRNAAVEKMNEIPGRQLPKEPDPLVEIRFAVHSNYAGMVAMLAADNRVYLGREERYHYQDGLIGLIITIIGLLFLNEIIRGLGASEILFPYCKEYLTIQLIFAVGNIMQVYYALYQQISELKADHPFIDKVMNGSGEISLTAEEHKILSDYFRLRFRLDDKERQRLYFRGHTDCISYLKKVGAL